MCDLCYKGVNDRYVFIFFFFNCPGGDLQSITTNINNELSIIAQRNNLRKITWY